MLRIACICIVFILWGYTSSFSAESIDLPVVSPEKMANSTQNIDFLPNKLIPLNIAIKGAFIPSITFSDGSSFARSKKFITELNYRWRDTVSLGAGFSFYSRNPQLLNSKREYKYRELFAIATWYPNYAANVFNAYYGLKANIYLMLWESSGDLDADDEQGTNFGLEPFVGVLIPVKDHMFIDLSVSYHIRTVSKLYHQEASVREKNVSDSHFLISAGLRF